MDERVQRVGGVRQLRLRLLLEGVGERGPVGGGDEGVLQEVVQPVAAVAAAEEDAQGLERLDGEPVAVRQHDRLVGEQMLGDAPGALDVLRVAVVVRGDLAFDTGVRGAVDLVGVDGEGRQPAGEERGAQPLGRGGQVPHGAEAAEALAEDGPGGAAGEPRPDGLAVADDDVGAEVREVVGLGAGAATQGERLAVGGRGGAGAALVEQEDPVLLQRPAEPRLLPAETVRPETGSAL